MRQIAQRLERAPSSISRDQP
ncbi:hypothetical protein JVX91_19400 [Pseudomonas sp. PDNC002]|nr:hypothetical protein JVX91_19400 [Pseudomonas sp. PDNC002]